MVSSDTDATTANSTRLFARNRADHRAAPSGVGEQARAMTAASAFPSSSGAAPGRGLSVRAASSPPAANRLRKSPRSPPGPGCEPGSAPGE